MERGEKDVDELLKHVREISRAKEAQVNQRIVAEADQIVKRVKQDTSQVVEAVKRLMPYPSETAEGGQEQGLGTPLRLSVGDRRVVVLSTPRGLEARSYSRTDITVNLKASGERLTKDGGGTIIVRTDRMLEVGVLDETLEIFGDGRIRCVAERQEPSRIGNLVREVAGNLVVE